MNDLTIVNNEDKTGIFKIGDLVTNKSIYGSEKGKSCGIVIKKDYPTLIFEMYYVWWFHNNTTISEYGYNLEYIKS